MPPDPHPIYESAFKIGDAAIIHEGQVLDEDGAGFDLSGGALAAQLRTSADSPVAVDLVVTLFEDENAVESVFEVSIDETDSAGLRPGRYEWDVEWDGGDGPQTVAGGVSHAVRDVTRS